MPVKVLVISNYRSTHTMRPEAEMFISLKNAGIDVNVMTYGDAEYAERFREAGIAVIDFHPEKKFDKEEIQRIREELIRGNYQVLHLFNSKAIINGIRAAKGLNVKVVLYRGYTGNIYWWDPSAYLKYLHPRVNKIICIAQSVEDHLRKALIYGKSKTIVINKGHLTQWYEEVMPANLSEFGIKEEDFVLACVANARPMKGIPWFIKAIGLLNSDLPLHFLLIGNDLLDEQISKLLKSNKNKDKIHFTGFRKDALSLVKASRVFVLPSVKGEATTKAVIEAMSMEICPLITDIAGNRELVIHKECGLVVPKKDPQALADAIMELYHHPETCKSYGMQAKKHIENRFNLKDSVVKTKRLYEDLAGRDDNS